MWYDPLTRKKFSSEAKYREATGSRKYRDLVRRSGAPAPEPVVTLRRASPTGASEAMVCRGQIWILIRSKFRISTVVCVASCSESMPVAHALLFKPSLVWWRLSEPGCAYQQISLAKLRRHKNRNLPVITKRGHSSIEADVSRRTGAEQPSQSSVTTTAQQSLPAPGYVVKPVLQPGIVRLDHNGLPAVGEVRRRAAWLPVSSQVSSLLGAQPMSAATAYHHTEPTIHSQQ